jgi:hypothetical protein
MRLANYKMFRDHLKRANMDLYTVELAFDAQPFQLEKDWENLKQIRCKDLMFQKERMLNVALQALPAKYDQVIWMDCDLFYAEDDWPRRVAKALKKYKVIQPYSYMVSLPNCNFSLFGDYQINYFNCYGSGRIKRSYAYYNSKRKTAPIFHHGHVGYVWAAHRDLLDRHKFYDPIISGAGDLFMLMAFGGFLGWLDYPPELKSYDMNAAIHFFDWAIPVYNETKGNIGYTEDLILHMWHGDADSRNYLSSSKCLQDNRFDPTKDLAIDRNGCWKWSSDKPKLHKDIKNIFGLPETT